MRGIMENCSLKSCYIDKNWPLDPWTHWNYSHLNKIKWTRSIKKIQHSICINNKNKWRECVEGACRGTLVECFGRVGISWGELKRDLEMYMINMHSLDVWNCQIINKRYSVKNKMGRNRRGQHLTSRHIIKKENIQKWTYLQVYIAHINNK